MVAQWFTAKSIVDGLLETLKLTAISGILGFVLGFILALMRLSASPLLVSVSWTFSWIFRSTPLLVQMLLWYNLGYLYEKISLGIPFTDVRFFEIQTTTLISQFAAAVLGLTLNQAAYSAEIIRGGILSVDQGQLEAAAALGIPAWRRSTRIVLPQAMRAILPTAFNEIIGLVKGTSIVYVLAYSELFYTVQVIYNRTQQVLPLLLVATLWYIAITSVLSVFQYYIERHYSKGAVRTLPLTPLQKARVFLSTHALSADKLQRRSPDEHSCHRNPAAPPPAAPRPPGASWKSPKSANPSAPPKSSRINTDGGAGRRGRDRWAIRFRQVHPAAHHQPPGKGRRRLHRRSTGRWWATRSAATRSTSCAKRTSSNSAPKSAWCSRTSTCSCTSRPWKTWWRHRSSHRVPGKPRLTKAERPGSGASNSWTGWGSRTRWRLPAPALRRPAAAGGDRRALALDPKILLFDEPTSALDPELVNEVLDVISELATSGTTLIIVTHEMGFARDVADTVVFMDEGQIVEQGSPQDIFTNPREVRTRCFFSKVIEPAFNI